MTGSRGAGGRVGGQEGSQGTSGAQEEWKRLRTAAWALCAVFVALAVLTIQTRDWRLFIASLIVQAAMLLTASASDRKKRK